MRVIAYAVFALPLVGASLGAAKAQTSPLAGLAARADARAQALEPKVIAWRRDLHQNPELANRETRTAERVADHLRTLGLEVRTGVARTGVIGVLTGGRPGPVVALRADMDALPLTEEVDLPFRSRARAVSNGQEVGVMHACGHDAHVAILMGVAEALAGVREELAGTVKFLFQPAGEGPPEGEAGGATQMVAEGALDDPPVEAIFGLHVISGIPAGTLTYRPGPMMASADGLTIRVKGRQTHGAWPWRGVDPVVIAAQIVLGVQTVVSRQVDISMEPAVVTIAMIHGGMHRNVIPEEVEIAGTVRTFDEAMRREIHERIGRIARSIAEAAGAHADVRIERAAPVTSNDANLTERMLPALQSIDPNARLQPRVMAAEDFAYFQQRVPGMFVLLGATPADQDMRKAAPNHSARFYLDESALLQGVRALIALALEYLQQPAGIKRALPGEI